MSHLLLFHGIMAYRSDMEGGGRGSQEEFYAVSNTVQELVDIESMHRLL